jgi:lipopolysaccharide export system protein LptA
MDRLLLNKLCAAALAAVGLCVAPAHAEKADRNKPMTVEADKPATVDLQRQVVVFNGNVVVSQGTMLIRAERIELREHSDGYRSAVATGEAGKLASFRQKRDGVDETVEGNAERIEYDARNDSLRFVGNAAVRRLRAGVVADEISGALITWDNTDELFSVKGGAASPNNPAGRVRAVFTPPEAAAASAPGAPAAPAAPGLKPSRSLGPNR